MVAEKIHSIRAWFPGEPRRAKHGETVCEIGRDVEFEAEALEAFCFQKIADREEELVLLAGVVAFADRATRRLAASGWRRSFRITMPVCDPVFWSKPEICNPLKEALRFLSGDSWSFEFVERRGRIPELKQDELDLGGGRFVVIPFSNGLDSFAQSQLLKLNGSSATPIRLTAWNRSLAGNRDWISDADGTRYRRVSVPVKVGADTHAEQSFRTRSFIFNVLAGLASYLSDAESVIIPEAGQGALGPSIVPLGAESPHRGSHPGFTRRMAEFFVAFWKKEIRIEHPQLWRTKGEVLALLKTNGLLTGWTSTRSCSRDQRVIRTERHVLLHCGICSGCLLRRLSVSSADLSEAPSSYLWSDLGAPSLDDALSCDARRGTTANDYDIAVHSVLAMEELARKAGRSTEDPALQSTIFDAFGDNSSEQANGLTQLNRLLSAHEKEWTEFKEKLGAASWINQQIALL